MRSRAALSILSFGAYCVVVGLVLVVSPGALLVLCRLPPAPEGYLRVLGAVVLTLGLYYVAAARSGTVAFFRWTVWGRPLACAIFCGLVALRLAPAVLILFGAIDCAGALWTGLALRASGEERCASGR